MNPPVLAFFNNKGGVGKTSLIYHLAWMYASLSKKVVIIDLDPQANLTASFLEDDRIEELWNEQDKGTTIYKCVKPLIDGPEILNPILEKISTNLFLLPGDVTLSEYEDELSQQWVRCLQTTGNYRPMNIQSSFWQVIQKASEQINAEIILIDIGPNLGAINRSALLATDYIVIPLGADLFSLQGLKNLGPTLKTWRTEWKNRLESWLKNKDPKYSNFKLPNGKMEPIGYLCQQSALRLERPVKAYDKWANKFPSVYRQKILEEPEPELTLKPADDPYCLAIVKHYRSLVPMAQEHRKPIFNLTTADGAIGSHAAAAQDAKKDFKILAQKIADKMGIVI